MDIKIGDIFHSTWGYDMTHNEYYQVVGITPSGKSVKVRKLESVKTVGVWQGQEEPLENKFIDKPKTKRLLESYDGKPALKMKSYEWAKLWNGQPNWFSHID